MPARCSSRPLPAYLLLNYRALGRCGAARRRSTTLARARCVVAVDAYASEEMKRVAHVLLPAGTFAETSGTYVNLEGRWQSQGGAAQAARRVRARRGRSCACSAICWICPASTTSPPSRCAMSSRRGIERRAAPPAACWPRARCRRRPPSAVIDLPMYQIDPVLRRAAPLLRTARWARASAAVRGRRRECADAVCGRQLPAYVHSTLFTLLLTRGADSVGRLPDAVGAQAHRLDADAHRPESRAHLRSSAAAWASRSPMSSSS